MARKSRKYFDTTSFEPILSTGIYRAGAYLRLSCDDTKKRGDSIETQQNIIENYIAAAPDISLTEVYIDNNTTGTNFERPGFQQMMADTERGKINCIIVKDLTRFGRNAIDAGYYLEKHLPTLGVRFIAVTDSYDSLDGNGGILLPLKNIISESYALDIGRKCRAVQRQNIADGRFVGRLAPYGYSKAPDDCRRLIINEETAPVVRRIYDWACEGLSNFEIAHRLSAENIPTPARYNYDKGYDKSDRQLSVPYWKPSTVKNILSDRVYVGDMVQGKTRKIDGKQRDVDPSEWVCVPNTHEPTIDRDVFDRLQVSRLAVYERAMEIQQNSTPYTVNVFQGKIVCAGCGRSMKRKRQNKDGTYWFRCESQWKYGKDACTVVAAREADLKTDILTILHKQAEAILGRYVTIEKAAAAPDNSAAELREVNQRMDKDGRMLRSLYENMVGGLITQDEFIQMKADYEGKIAALSKQADEIRERKYTTKAAATEYRDIAEAVAAAISDDTLTTEIIDRLVDKIKVHPDKSFEVLYKFRDEFREVRRVG